MFEFYKRWFPAKNEIKKPKQAIKQAVSMLRREYDGSLLDEHSLDPDPIRQFTLWFDITVETIRNDPNAMILSTVSPAGQPSSRTVLLKGFDENGFIFYTNYNGRKSRHITQNPAVSLTFYWPDLMRQIHIEGIAEKTSEDQSDQYFKSRPDSSKLSAWASKQTETVPSREELENQLREMEEKFKNKEIPRPPNWGGYLVKPNRIEFWQGRLNRLHDRICYQKENDKWILKRLSP